MSEDDRKPSPESPSLFGETDDPYNASTVVGKAPPDLLALLRGGGALPKKPPLTEARISQTATPPGGIRSVSSQTKVAAKPVLAAEASSDESEAAGEARSSSASVIVAPEIAAESARTPSDADIETKPPASRSPWAHATPLSSRPPPPVSPERAASAMPPVVTILFFFVCATLTLAALVR